MLVERSRLDSALTVLISSYVMNGVGLLIACGLMVLYFQRLTFHHLPPRELIVSTFLPLGPCGQGGFALIELVSGAACGGVGECELTRVESMVGTSGRGPPAETRRTAPGSTLHD